MARAGLGANWTCTFANDIDPKKADAYAANFGRRGLVVGDVGALKAADLSSRADLTGGSPLARTFPRPTLAVASRAP
jgi:DNA (cytosine-5)-methyltransferase 1